MHTLTEHDLTIEQGEHRLVAHLGGNLSIRNAAEVHRVLLDAWRHAASDRELIVDLANTRHIDSSGVGVLLELVSDGVPLSLCNLQASPRRLLDRTGLSTIFRVHSDCANSPAHPQAA